MKAPTDADRATGRALERAGRPFDPNGIACGAMTFALLLSLGLAGGGLSPRSWRVAVLALCLGAAAALLTRERIAIARREWVLVGALGALAAWMAVSAAWSSVPSASIVEAERGLLYALATLVALIAVERSSIGHVVVGAVAGIAITSVYALARYLASPPPYHDFRENPLLQPFGYSNALAAFVAIGIVLSVGLFFWARSGRERGAAAATLLLLGATLLATASRGAWVAVAVGSVVVLYLNRQLGRRWLVALLVGGVALGLTIGSLSGEGFLSHEEPRADYWRVAWHDVTDNPLLGSGSGTFGDYLLRHEPGAQYAHDAHSLYLETLAELGPVGLSLLIVGLAVPLLGLRRRQGPVVAAAGGAYITFLVHAGVDWDWEFAAVVLAGLSAAVVATIGTRPTQAAPISERGRYALLAGLSVVPVAGIVRLLTGEA